MIYNQLGKSDIFVSAIGFGAMSLDLSQPQIAESLLHFAKERGVNFIDTADLYDKGANEELVGDSIRSFRKDIILATKVGNKWRSDGTGWDWDVSSGYIRQAIEESLTRLRTDYIDLYQVHGGTNQDNYEEVIGTLEDLVLEGKIRTFGISSIRPNVFTKYCEQSNIASNMMQYSIFDRRPELYFSTFEKSDVSIIARGTLAQGLLVDKMPKAYLGYSQGEIEAMQVQLKAYAQELGLSTLAFALAFALRNSVVTSAVLGARTKEQFYDIISACDSVQNLAINFESIDFPSHNYTQHLL